MNGIQKTCMGKFLQPKMQERECSKCTSIALCVSETNTKPEKLYISIKQMDDNELKKELLEIRPLFLKHFENLGLKPRTCQELWKTLQKLCIIMEKSPKSITIMDIANYLEFQQDRPSLNSIISHFRRIAKDWYNYTNWNIIQPPRVVKTRNFKNIIDKTFYDTEIYINYKKWFAMYSKNLATKSIKIYSTVIENFLKYCFLEGVITEQPKIMLKKAYFWVSSQSVTANTKKSYRMILKQYFETHLEQMSFKAKFRPYKDTQPKLKKVPSDNELKLLSKYIKTDQQYPWLWPLFGVLVYTGARITSICNIETDSVDLDHGIIHMTETKTGDVDIPIIVHLDEILREYIPEHIKKYPNESYLFLHNGKSPTQEQIRKIIKIMSDKLNIPYYPPHHYRARIALTLYQQSNWNISFVKDFLNHKSQKTTESYIKAYRKDIMRQDYNPFIPKLLD